MNRPSLITNQRLLTLLLALACTVPLLALDLPPMTDVLGHIGRYSIQVGLDQHPWLKQYFSFDWKLVGNLGADLLVQVLAPGLGVEKAVKVILILDQLLASLGIILLCRRIHGRITPFCLFALPLIYGHPFTYGFINFTLSMGLAFLAFVLWLRLEGDGARKLRVVLFVPISLGLWLCHTYGWVFLGILCTGQCLAVAREQRATLRGAILQTGWRCQPLLAPVLPMLVWRGSGAGGASTDWFDLPPKAGWIMSVFRLDHGPVDLLSAAGVIALIFVAFRVARLRSDRRLLIAAGICAIAYMALPRTVFGSSYADMRLAPYLLIVVLLSIRTENLAARWNTWLMIAGVSFMALRLGLTTETYLERERRVEAELQALTVIPQGARVASLVVVPCGYWEMPWLTHVGSMAIARRNAFSNDQWDTPGMNLLSIHYPQAGGFVSDKSEFVVGRDCSIHGPKLETALAALPTQAFTHLWIVGVAPRVFPERNDLRMVWRGHDAAVYRVVP